MVCSQKACRQCSINHLPKHTYLERFLEHPINNSIISFVLSVCKKKECERKIERVTRFLSFLGFKFLFCTEIHYDQGSTKCAK